MYGTSLSGVNTHLEKVENQNGISNNTILLFSTTYMEFVFQLGMW